MNKTELKIPTQIGYLSQWPDFDSYLPIGKIIVNKVICGCGMTHYYLTNPSPVILISPRKNLILSKIKDPKLPHIHYFDRGNPKEKLEDSVTRLTTYLNNPFISPSFVPKILVTYDSFPKVEEVLMEMGVLSRFTLIVDEFSCLFTDARIKGLTDMKLLSRVLSLPNRTVFISATPIKEIYLDELKELQNMTYVTLEWDPSHVRTISLSYRPMKSTRSAICGIIDNFNTVGYFQKLEIGGQQVYSREGIFFLNSLKDIKAVVQKKGLTKTNTRVVCADTDENKRMLRDIGLDVDTFPSRLDYQQENKTFTFVTRACFEGSDLYSDSATTFVFADSNRENLSLDVSIDLTQIIGRCRTMTNPFINDVFYYFRTTDKSKFDYQVECNKVQNRLDTTLEYMSTNSHTLSPLLLRKFNNAQKKEDYRDDYLDVITDNSGNGQMIFNKLVYIADIRAVEIKHNQYQNPQTLLLYLSENGFRLNTNPGNTTNSYDLFLNTFNLETMFDVKLKMLFKVLNNDPELWNQILQDDAFPMDFKDFVTILGWTVCSQLNFNEVKIRETRDIKIKEPILLAEVKKHFHNGQGYRKKTIKEALQKIYNNLGINRKAKAVQILEYFPSAIEVNIPDKNKKRQKGYKI